MKTLLPFALFCALSIVSNANGDEIITSLPYTINQSGTYRLQDDLVLEGNSDSAIRINSDDVKLDLSGHSVRSGTGASATAIGVLAMNRKRVTVENGAIVGFSIAVSLDSYDETAGPIGLPPSALGGFYRVKGLRIEGASQAGIRVNGYSAEIIENNLARCGQSMPAGKGILAQGAGIVVKDNNILSCGKPGENGGAALSIEFADGATVFRNSVSGFRIDNANGPIPSQAGISVLGSPAITIKDNTVARFNVGILAVNSSGVQTSNVFSNVSNSVKGPLKRGFIFHSR